MNTPPKNKPWLMDLSRMISRLGEPVATGVDRVEAAYLEQALADPASRFLIRFYGKRLTIIDGEALMRLMTWAPRLARLSGKPRRIAQAALIRYYAPQSFAEAGLVKALTPYSRYHYVNVGHANLRAGLFTALDYAHIPSLVMIHDLIPLDYPEYCRTDRIAPFRDMIGITAQYATHIVCPSEYSAERMRFWAIELQGTTPRVFSAPLAFDALHHTEAAREGEADNAYIIIGTLEPRKNHEFLLDLWDTLHKKLGDDCPHLWIVGKVGWLDPMVLSRINHGPLAKRFIHNFGPVDDATMRDYLSRARALLFPSAAEGFGLPFFEALAAKRPVIANDLSVFCELHTQGAMLIPLEDTHRWIDTLADFRSPEKIDVEIMTWHQHFAKILQAIVT